MPIITSYSEDGELNSNDQLLGYNQSTSEVNLYPGSVIKKNVADGWVPTDESWGYSSFDSASAEGTINTGSGADTKYSTGMRVRFEQSTGGTKYGIIIAVDSSSVDVYMGDDTLENEAITSPHHSAWFAPFGLPDGLKLAPGSVAQSKLDASHSFHAYRDATLNTTGNTLEAIVFDSERYDRGENFDTSTGQFTAPVAGIYRFFSSVNTGDSFNVRAVLRFNCSTAGVFTIFDTEVEPAGSNAQVRRVNGALEIDLVESETVEVEVLTQVATDISDASTFFAGGLVGK